MCTRAQKKPHPNEAALGRAVRWSAEFEQQSTDRTETESTEKIFEGGAET